MRPKKAVRPCRSPLPDGTEACRCHNPDCQTITAMAKVVEAAREMNEAAKNVIARATFHHDAKTIPLEDALVDAWGPFNHALVALDAVKEKDRAAEAELR